MISSTGMKEGNARLPIWLVMPMLLAFRGDLRYVTKPCDVRRKITLQDEIRRVVFREDLGGDFVLRGPNPFLKSDQIVMRLTSHG